MLLKKTISLSWKRGTSVIFSWVPFYILWKSFYFEKWASRHGLAIKNSAAITSWWRSSFGTWATLVWWVLWYFFFFLEMFLFLYPKKPVAKPSLSNPSLPYKMGKEKSVRNDNKEEQKLQKMLNNKNLFLLLTKNKNSYRQSQLFL